MGSYRKLYSAVLLAGLLLIALSAPLFAQGDGVGNGNISQIATPAPPAPTGLDSTGWMGALTSMPGQDWFRLVLSTLTILLIAYIVGKAIYAIVHRLVRRTESSLDDVLLETIRPLIPWLLVAIGFQIATYRIGLSAEVGTQVLQHVYFLLYLTVVFFAVWRLIHYITAWYIIRVPDGQRESVHALLPLIQRTAQIALILLTFLILLEHFNIQFVALATALGLGGLALSLAAKDALTDVISGVIIIIDQPFRLGDRIEIQGVDTWGDVVSIGLRTTHIRTPDNRTVIVPNSVIGNNLIVNHSYPDLRVRVQTEVGLPYGIDISEGRQIVELAIRQEAGVILDQPVEVLLRRFGDSSLIVCARWWIDSYIGKQQSIDRVNAAIYRALNTAHIQIPFPQRDLHHIVAPEQLATLAKAVNQGQPMQ